jgi:hypothetical protein
MAGDFAVEITGLPELAASLTVLGEASDAATGELVRQLQAELVRRAQDNFQGTHAPHRPHVGGKFPNIVTGNLQRSIFAEGTYRLTAGMWEGTVSPHAKYGRRVEMGYGKGPGGPNSPHPYFGPAVREVRDIAEAFAASAYGRVFA